MHGHIGRTMHNCNLETRLCVSGARGINDLPIHHQPRLPDWAICMEIEHGDSVDDRQDRLPPLLRLRSSAGSHMGWVRGITVLLTAKRATRQQSQKKGKCYVAHDQRDG
jgi:hypothetical protein